MWEVSNNVDIKKIMCESANWIHLPEDTVQWRDLVNIIVNFWVPQRSLLTSRTAVRLSRKIQLHGVSHGQNCKIQN
jgi:hypothetical protein